VLARGFSRAAVQIPALTRLSHSIGLLATQHPSINAQTGGSPASFATSPLSPTALLRLSAALLARSSGFLHGCAPVPAAGGTGASHPVFLEGTASCPMPRGWLNSRRFRALYLTRNPSVINSLVEVSGLVCSSVSVTGIPSPGFVFARGSRVRFPDGWEGEWPGLGLVV
jgi:hypothetical protein